MEGFRVFWQTNPSIFPDQDNLYPAPFFGDIRNAEVLTLALNPAWTEFGRDRHWMPGLDPRSLTTRLLHYFDLPEPSPHDWFTHREGTLEQISSSYKENAAHIDLLSYPTKLRRLLNDAERRVVGRLIESSGVSRLCALVRLATKARMILVKDYTFSKANGEIATVLDFISANQVFVRLLRSRRIQLR
jgi:hypothetical protein